MVGNGPRTFSHFSTFFKLFKKHFKTVRLYSTRITFRKITCFRRPTTLFKKSLAQMFSCEFCEISKNTFFTEHLRKIASGDYVFDMKSLSFTSPYSQNLIQKTKEGSTLNKYLNILFVVFQGSVLRPLLFIIFIGNLFHKNYHLESTSYANHSLPLFKKV